MSRDLLVEPIRGYQFVVFDSLADAQSVMPLVTVLFAGESDSLVQILEQIPQLLV